eukprot:Gregarina_sp_Poly_1__4182@NODE_228_length_11160_cov_127_571532_g202_i0_p3_GENE_NODE_228_length_11160_cov_127_571532_g202_i0NODE_228_length_11160_cov_127_571532_g202_i0_p3_ORF_typecomplete_len944_score89_86Glyco_hydro_31/PF01055_26/7_2e124Gal_mutarotas_2/PF13802_6/3_2e14Gal_mutarotas_2/PF13802_6/2e02DUF4968/PF16338_5/0_04_NODE_228_length_11160_cov_127_571532_g202_i0822311054
MDLILLFSALLSYCLAANRSKYRKCADSPFCNRYRHFAEHRFNNAPNQLHSWSVGGFDVDSLRFDLEIPCNECATKILLHCQIQVFFPGFVRLLVDDLDDRRFRQTDTHVFEDASQLQFPRESINVKEDASSVTVSWQESQTGSTIVLEVDKNPWRISLTRNGAKLMAMNSDQLLNFEMTRSLDDHETLKKARVDATALLDIDAWETWFDGQMDKSLLGPQAVGLDIQFLDSLTSHGFGEHAVPWDLPPTDAFPNKVDVNEPYRFWNSDIPQYELNTPMALYAALPFLFIVHNPLNQSQAVSAVMWNNPSETFVDLKKDKHTKEFRTWWASETGIIDLFIFTSSNMQSITKQYHILTGHPPDQMQNTFGLHQCRWNYESQEDLMTVAKNYDSFGIPVDYLWLDIDHTEHRKYFTWNSRFPEPQAMVDFLSARKQGLVAIVDPHVKVEEGYPIYNTLDKEKLFITDDAGESFRGWCWPGDSNYPDVMSPRVRQAYHRFFAPSYWVGTAKSPSGPPLPNAQLADACNLHSRVQLWNDMNEPSVFNKPEITLPRNTFHLEGYAHRAIHNLYGLNFHRTTFEAILASDNKKRPFVLTRAAYFGSHRYGAIWTGDNIASWSHLEYSVPMLLNLASCGMSFAGADIGGFFFNPDEALLSKWFQVGIWYPFMRSHAALATRRREVFLLSKIVQSSVKKLLLLRYRLIPFWYSVAARYALDGTPMISSVGDFNLRYGGKTDQNQLAIDYAFLVGDTFLVVPVLHKQETTKVLQLPGDPNIEWFEFFTGTVRGHGWDEVQVFGTAEERERGVVFVKGATILATRERQRRSVDSQRFDPFTLSVYASGRSSPAHAEGFIYLDNYLSNGADGCWIKVELKQTKSAISIASTMIGKANCTSSINSEVEKLILYNFPSDLRFSLTDAFVRQHSTFLEIKLRNRSDITRLSLFGSLG